MKFIKHSIISTTICLSLLACSKPASEKADPNVVTTTSDAEKSQQEVTNGVEKSFEAPSPKAMSLITPYFESGKPSVAIFRATWCPACNNFKTVLEGISPQFTDVKFVNVDIDEEKELTKAFNVNAIPSLFFFDSNGQFLHSKRGAIKGEELIADLKEMQSNTPLVPASSKP